MRIISGEVVFRDQMGRKCQAIAGWNEGVGILARAHHTPIYGVIKLGAQIIPDSDEIGLEIHCLSFSYSCRYLLEL